MKTYQQVILYFWPLLGQLQFINTIVVLVRLHWFEKKFKDIGMFCLLLSSGKSCQDFICNWRKLSMGVTTN